MTRTLAVVLLLVSSAASAAEPPAPALWRISAVTEAAFGLSGDRFYNHLTGVRVDHRFSERIFFGLSLQHVSLKGKNGRAHNVLPQARLEFVRRLTPELVTPFTYSMGYVANNGPTLRLDGGLRVSIGERSHLALGAGPMAWFTHDTMVWSLNGAIELGTRF